MGRPRKIRHTLPKAEPSLTPNSNPTWHMQNLNKAALIWITELRLHELDYHHCPFSEEYALEKAFDFSSNRPSEATMRLLSDALRDYMLRALDIHIERFVIPGKPVKICMPDSDMMDTKARYLLGKAGREYKAVIKMDQRHPELLTLNPTQELATNVSTVMTQLAVPVEEKKMITQVFAESYANQMAINGMSKKEIRKELAAGLFEILNRNPSIKAIDDKRPDAYTQACKEMEEGKDGMQG